MSKHRHYDMIVAKAANMELVTLIKFGDEWMISAPHETGVILTFDDRYEYFLCLPQHKDACLQWLNGGDAEENYGGNWGDIVHHDWHEQSLFMFNDGYTIRIKPKKEKRWFVYSPEHDSMASVLMKSPPKNMNKGHQLIEIEVEV